MGTFFLEGDTTRFRGGEKSQVILTLDPIPVFLSLDPLPDMVNPLPESSDNNMVRLLPYNKP